VVKIDKNLVIEYKDIVWGNPENESYDCPTYNNQDFFETSVERLRFKLNELDVDIMDQDNKFYKCFDENSLEILKPNEWEELSKMSYDDLIELVEQNEWEWLGDDFDDMLNYLNFITKHNPTLRFSHEISDNDERMFIYLHDITDKFKTQAEINTYDQGLRDAQKVLLED
tara:strand:- start:696 stop:1205 length:510 start_codon:yes stop_codon:yes gene_type:complete